jgi:hypothetical protein
MVASILVLSMIINRKRGYRIFERRRRPVGLLEEDPDSARSSDDLLSRDLLDPEVEDEESSLESMMKDPPKKRRCCCATIYTPNTSRFADHYHSRILQKFPFLIEMFYWIITYAFYRCTKVLTQAIFSEHGVWEVAQDHGLAILDFEQYGWLSFLWPIRELQVQQWFMHGHQTMLTILNRSYALIHIPGTVGYVSHGQIALKSLLTISSFIGWWYYVAPSHATFALVRRTMTLTNLLAFCIFVCYPCMPPRLLPREYGFLDTVGHDDGQSVWMKGKFVNTLAAMPSMHFGYAFEIGCVLLYHSGVFRETLEPGERRKSKSWVVFYVLLAIAYPSWILITIIATANHYYLDACIAFFVALISYACNRVFLGLLPLEDLLLWCLRLEKPSPTTGDRFRQRLISF